MDKYAGVTLDYFDDKGALIKEKFPEADQLPGVIKTSNVKPKESLPDEAFALVALDGGHVMRKFACVDPGTTAMSVIYFMENRHKLPEGAVKTAAHNLFNACVRHGLVPPEELTKAAEAGSSTPDITGQSPKPKFAAAPMYDEDYAVVTDDGQRRYPIHDWDHIKQACDYWAIESRRMDPQTRRQFAVKLASKAHDLGYPIDDETLLEAGAVDYADEGHVKMAMDMRKVALPGEDNTLHRSFLDELLEKRASGMHPEVFAECVRRFDIMNDLDAGWDNIILSPWESTFGMEKEAQVLWEDGADRVTLQDLRNLALNHPDEMTRTFSDELTRQFPLDPEGIFNSLPLPQKRIMARLATDVARGGGSESPYTGEFDKKASVDDAVLERASKILEQAKQAQQE